MTLAALKPAASLVELTAGEIAAAVASGRMTCEAVGRAHLERIEEREPQVLAWQYLDPAQVLEQARALDRRVAREDAEEPRGLFRVVRRRTIALLMVRPPRKYLKGISNQQSLVVCPPKAPEEGACKRLDGPVYGRLVQRIKVLRRSDPIRPWICPHKLKTLEFHDFRI